MIKVLSVVDKKGTAIDRLAEGAKKYSDRFEHVIVDVHPKRPGQDQLKRFEQHLDADVFDFMYFRTAQLLTSLYKVKGKKILHHYNPYSITESDWSEFDQLVACNEYIYKELPKLSPSPVEYVPLTVDTDFWTFNPDWSPNRNVLMVANRIESKKGILEVAQACKLANADFHLVGSVSDQDYFFQVLQATNVKFYERISDEQLRELYYGSTVHVCNSVDNFESGTLPILEAMLCGTPVLTRKVGHVSELYNGENMVINEESKDNVEHLASLMKQMLDNPSDNMRQKAWSTAKSRSNERRAYMLQRIYRNTLFDQVPVSVVMPVSDKPDLTAQSIAAIEKQTHKNIELIMINDGRETQPTPNVPYFKQVQNFNDDYGLARARNKGIIDATGEIIVFCDQRIVMEPDAIEEFVKNIRPRVWLYGTKGAKKDFVENFSCVNRDEVIRLGMFSERIDEYGGQSQEVRNRARYQGIKTEYLESAKAVQIGSSKNKFRKRDEIIRMKNRLWRMNLE